MEFINQITTLPFFYKSSNTLMLSFFFSGLRRRKVPRGGCTPSAQLHGSLPIHEIRNKDTFANIGGRLPVIGFEIARAQLSGVICRTAGILHRQQHIQRRFNCEY